MQVSSDRTQTLEVLGTLNLLNVLWEQLETEGGQLMQLVKACTRHYVEQSV
jgi:hypothetical protein